MIPIAELLTSDGSGDQALSSVYEIEDVLLMVSEINRKVTYYKELKKYRAASIDEKIADLTEKNEILRQIIFNTMKKVAPNEKTLNFPSIGKVSRRKSQDSWSVTDEDALLDFLEGEGRKDEVVKTSTVIDKRKLNAILAEFSKIGTSVPGSASVSGQESLSVTFEKPSEASKNVTEPASLDIEQLDALTV